MTAAKKATSTPRTNALVNDGADSQNQYITKLIALCRELELETIGPRTLDSSVIGISNEVIQNWQWHESDCAIYTEPDEGKNCDCRSTQ